MTKLLEASRRGGVLPALLLGVLVSLATIGLSSIGAFEGWQTRAVDAFQFLRDREPPAEIALVQIDEDAFRELGERQPLSRRFLAELADFLLRSGARVVALDILLQAPTSPEEDQAFVAMAGRWPGRLVLAQEAVPGADGKFEAKPHFSPELNGPSGFVNAPVEKDGLVRRFDPVLPAAAAASSRRWPWPPWLRMVGSPRPTWRAPSSRAAACSCPLPARTVSAVRPRP